MLSLANTVVSVGRCCLPTHCVQSRPQNRAHKTGQHQRRVCSHTTLAKCEAYSKPPGSTNQYTATALQAGSHQPQHPSTTSVCLLARQAGRPVAVLTKQLRLLEYCRWPRPPQMHKLQQTCSSSCCISPKWLLCITQAAKSACRPSHQGVLCYTASSTGTAAICAAIGSSNTSHSPTSELDSAQAFFAAVLAAVALLLAALALALALAFAAALIPDPKSS